MTLAQAALLFRLLIHGSFEVRRDAAIARACVRRGWVEVVGLLNRCAITDEGRMALKTLFPAVVESLERKQRLERSLFAGVYCLRCGSDDTMDLDSSWRWNGENWEHRCRDIHPQAGYDVPDPIADLKRLRATLISMQDGGEPLPSSLFHEVATWRRKDLL